MIRRLITYLLLVLLLPCAALAQTQKSKDAKPSKMNQARWEKEMKQYKNDFIVKSLDITEAQKAKFLQLYDKMDDELLCLNRQTMDMARSVMQKGDAATDIEREKAAEAQFELKSKEGAIEMKYYKEFRKVLSPAQLLKLKGAERNFSRQLMNKHRERNAKHTTQTRRQATSMTQEPTAARDKRKTEK